MLLGIDLGGTNIRIGQVDGTALVKKLALPSPAQMELGPSLDYLKQHIGSMLTPAVEAVGIGVPSVVDIARGIVYNVTNIPSWREVHLKDELEKAFGLPVYVNNDANTFALGEKEYGAGRDYKDVIAVTLGTGVGAGVVINGALYAGRNTGAGEIGCLPYLDATLEDYCGSNFFSRLHSDTGREAAARAEKGDKAALALWDEFGGHMGALMHIVMFAYDPELVIFGGGIASAWPLFERSMRARMAEFPYPETVKNIVIKISDNPDIQIFGAAALAKRRVTSY